MAQPTKSAQLSACWTQAKAGISFAVLLPLIITFATKILPVILSFFGKSPKLTAAIVKQAAAIDWGSFFSKFDFAKIIELVQLIIGLFAKVAPKGATAIDWGKLDWTAIFNIIKAIIAMFGKASPTPDPSPNPSPAPGPVA